MQKIEKVGPTHYRLRDFAYGDVQIAVDKYLPYKETECGWWVIDETLWPSCGVFAEEQVKRIRRWVPKDSPAVLFPEDGLRALWLQAPQGESVEALEAQAATGRTGAERTRASRVLEFPGRGI